MPGIRRSTGCSLCIKRRLKCDEKRPACERCQKYGVECAGYSRELKFVVGAPRRPRPKSHYNFAALEGRGKPDRPSTISDNVSPTDPRLSLDASLQRPVLNSRKSLAWIPEMPLASHILGMANCAEGELCTQCDGYPEPRDTERCLFPVSESEASEEKAPPQCLINRINSGPAFESEEDLRYFRIFCQEIATTISGPFKSSLWGRLIPQISETVPFIRHAVIAIGVLSKISIKAISYEATAADERDGYSQRLKHQYALQQYGKALNGMRKAIEVGEHDLRTAMIACLLAFMFETLQGRQGPASAIATSGLGLFQDYISGYNNRSRTLPSPSYCALEDDLIQAVTNLDLHVASFLDQRPLAIHQRVIDDTAEAIFRMPSKFADLVEARNYLQMIMRRNFHFKSKAQILGKAAELAGVREESTWTETAEFGAGKVPFSRLKDPSSEIQAACQEYTSDIYRWLDAASSIFDSVADSDLSSRLIVTLLKIQVNLNIITLAGITFTTESAFDMHHSEFRAITELSASIYPQLVSSSQNSGFYSFDIGILPAIAIVGTQCRDRAIRDEAINLLHSSPYREGVWDGEAAGAISAWVRMIEEEEYEPGEHYIPESRRIFFTGADVDLYHTRAKLYATQRKGHRGEDLVFREGFIRW